MTGGDAFVRRRQLCKHHCGREPGSESRENGCESLINLVNLARRKMLVRLNQTVRGQVDMLANHVTQLWLLRGRGGSYPLRDNERNAVSPMCSWRTMVVRKPERKCGRQRSG